MSASRRHKAICFRDPAAGIGSCWWWWEGCPEKVAGCDLRRQRALQGAQAKAWWEYRRAVRALADEALAE